MLDAEEQNIFLHHRKQQHHNRELYQSIRIRRIFEHAQMPWRKKDKQYAHDGNRERISPQFAERKAGAVKKETGNQW